MNNTAAVRLVLVAGFADGDGPKFQAHEVAPVPPSANETARGAQPDTGVALILATGSWAMAALPTMSRHRIRISFLFNG